MDRVDNVSPQLGVQLGGSLSERALLETEILSLLVIVLGQNKRRC
jgi:hypothetical protein